MAQTKTLIITRHAHRNKPKGGEADNGLSAKGRKQARALAKFYTRVFSRKKARIYSSPKIRCVETIEPIAKKIKVSLETLDSLNETPTESERLQKVRAFHSFWLSSDAPLTLICSHGDWIPAYLKSVFGIEIDLDKGGWLEVEQDSNADAKPTLRWIVQDPSV